MEPVNEDTQEQAESSLEERVDSSDVLDRKPGSGNIQEKKKKKCEIHPGSGLAGFVFSASLRVLTRYAGNRKKDNPNPSL